MWDNGWGAVVDGEPLTQTDIQAVADLAHPNFYSEWVDQAASGQVGTPILGISSVSYDSVAGELDVTVSQVQGSLSLGDAGVMPYSNFSSVAFTLGCIPHLNDVVGPAFQGCAADRWYVNEAPALASATGVDRIISAATPGLPVPPTPVDVGLLSNVYLLPEAGVLPDDALPTAHTTYANPYKLYCLGAATGSCDPVLDADGDGYTYDITSTLVLPSDCNDGH